MVARWWGLALAVIHIRGLDYDPLHNETNLFVLRQRPSAIWL